jgi:predicted deacylase
MTRLVSLLLFSCLAALNAHAVANTQSNVSSLVDGPHILEDSGVRPWPKYLDIQNKLLQVAVKFPKQAQVVKYGKTVKNLDLTLLRIESPSANRTQPGRPAVEISGAIHGNEYLGIEENLAIYFLEHQNELRGFQLFMAAGGVVYVIPVVNPDGFERQRRQNFHGEDLNRDFDILPTGEKKFTQPETQALARYIDSEMTGRKLRLAFSLDYHCCVPAFITPWTYTDAYPSQPDLAVFNEVTELQKKTIGFEAGNAAATVGYLAPGSTVDYFYAKYGTLAFTIEGRSGGEAQQFAQHVRFFDALFERLALKTLNLD